MVLHLHQYRLVCADGGVLHGRARVHALPRAQHAAGRAPQLSRQPRRGAGLRRLAGAVAAAPGRAGRRGDRAERVRARASARAGRAAALRARARASAAGADVARRGDGRGRADGSPGEAAEHGRPCRTGAGRYALVVARLAPEKGIDVAIDACRIAGVPLVVAGEGPERDILRARARAHAGHREMEAPPTHPGYGERHAVARTSPRARGRGAPQSRKPHTRARGTTKCASSGGWTTPSSRACARAPRSRSFPRARPRRSGWPPPRRWPRGCRSSRAASGRWRSWWRSGLVAAGRRGRARRGDRASVGRRRRRGARAGAVRDCAPRRSWRERSGGCMTESRDGA